MGCGWRRVLNQFCKALGLEMLGTRNPLTFPIWHSLMSAISIPEGLGVHFPRLQQLELGT